MILRSDDTDLFYEVRGEGPDVVLLHPFPCDHDFWLPLVNIWSRVFGWCCRTCAVWAALGQVKASYDGQVGR